MDLNGRGNGNAKPRTKARTLVVGLDEVGAAAAAILDRMETVLQHDLAPVKIAEPVGTVLSETSRSIAQASGAAVAYSPVRGKDVRMQKDLVLYFKFVAAPTEADAARARAESHFQAAGMKTRRMAEEWLGLPRRSSSE